MTNRARNKKYRKRNRGIDRRQTFKVIAAVILLIVTVVLGMSMCQNNEIEEASVEVRGVWVSYIDFDKLGFKDKTEEEFRANAEVLFDRAEELKINTVYFHVRAFRDAVYKSDNFPVSKYIWTRPEEIPYDPLEIMVEMAHERNMELHAWMNPYRNSSSDEPILDPGEQASTDEILLCVNEVTGKYDIDGVHFDDYFYEEGDMLDNSIKMENVNKMIKQVYDASHENGVVFGISPAGNVGYSESLGADVKTWLSESGYVDYVIPQIYWTNEHTAQWRDKMFSDTLDEWISLNTADIHVYVGLALYKAGIPDTVDPGWAHSSTNISSQIKELREKGIEGYSFFSAADLFREGAEAELMEYGKLEL